MEQSSAYKKKLKPFFEAGKASGKRIKALQSWLADDASVPFQQEFFQRNAEVVLQVFDHMFQGMAEAAANPKNRGLKSSEVLDVFKVIEALIVNTHDSLRSGLGGELLTKYIEHMVCAENKHQVRRLGLNLLLLYLDALREKSSDHLIRLLMYSLTLFYFKTMCARPDEVDVPSEHPNGSITQLAPEQRDLKFKRSKHAMSLEEALEMFESLFSHIENHASHLGSMSEGSKKVIVSFWAQILNKHVYPLLYREDMGFRGQTPPNLQAVVAQRIVAWMGTPAGDVMFSDHDAVRMSMWILRHGLVLSGAGSIVGSIISLYRNMLQRRSRPALMAGSQLQDYIRILLVDLVSVFECEGAHVQTSHVPHIKVLQIYRTHLPTANTEFDEETRSSFIRTLLRSAHAVMFHVSADLHKHLLEPVVEVALSSYVHARPKDDDLWMKLQESMARWRGEIRVWFLWKSILRALVTFMIEFTHGRWPTDEQLKDLDATRVAASAMQLQNARPSRTSISAGNTYDTPDQHMLGSLVRAFDSEDLQKAAVNASYLVGRFLQAGGNLSEITSPPIHALALSAIAECVDLWANVTDTTPVARRGQTPPPPRVTPSVETLLAGFGEHLFLACESGTSETSAGRSVAVGALCRAFSSPNNTPASATTNARFLRAIHAALTMQSSSKGEIAPEAAAVLEHGCELLARSVPGTLLLVPAMLRACENVYVTPASYSTKTRSAVVKIVSTIIPTVRQYASLVLPALEGSADRWAFGPDLASIGSEALHQEVLDAVSEVVLEGVAEENAMGKSIRRDVHALVLKMASKEPDANLRCSLLWTLQVLVTEECRTPKVESSANVILKAVTIILQALHGSSGDALRSTSFAVLNSLSSGVSYLEELSTGAAIVKSVVEHLCEEISRDIAPGQASTALACLLEWVMASRHPLLSNNMVMSALEAVSTSSDTSLKRSAQIAVTHLLAHYGHYPPDAGPDTISSVITESDPCVGEAATNGSGGDPSATTLSPSGTDSGNSTPRLGSGEGKSLGRSMSSSSAGAIAAGDDGKRANARHFILRSTHIITLADVEERGTVARIIVRDMTGRYSWDAVLRWNSGKKRGASDALSLDAASVPESPRTLTPSSAADSAASAAEGADAAAPAGPASASSDDAPRALSHDALAVPAEDESTTPPSMAAKEAAPLNAVDAKRSASVVSTDEATPSPRSGSSSSFLQQASLSAPRAGYAMRGESSSKATAGSEDEENPAITPARKGSRCSTYVSPYSDHIPRFTAPSETHGALTQLLQFVEADGVYEPAKDTLVLPASREEAAARLTEEDELFGTLAERHAKQENEPKQAVSALQPSLSNLADDSISRGKFDIARLFLAHTGRLTSQHMAVLRPLKMSSKLLRSLSQLDKSRGRECQKIGVIFVGNGQDSQREILRNERGSPRYERFVDGLGWNVELSRHGGFLGGLNTDGSNGTDAPYFASSTLEVIFHVVTRMPTSPDDVQQIHKKRHVGNDIVNIIWSEHTHDYRPQTITSQFNNVHIVVYPRADRLCRVQVHRKEGVPTFGPLQDGMVVSEDVVSELVRQTCVNAYRAVRFQTEGYKRPQESRADLIREIFERYTDRDATLKEYLEDLF